MPSPCRAILALLGRPKRALRGDQAQADEPASTGNPARTALHAHPGLHGSCSRATQAGTRMLCRRERRQVRLPWKPYPNPGRGAHGPVHGPLVRRPIVAALAAPVLKLERHLRSAGVWSGASTGRRRKRSCCAPPPVAGGGCGCRAPSLALPARRAPLRQRDASAPQPLMRNCCWLVLVRWCAHVRQSVHTQRQLEYH